jgi:hypothetical protein
MTGLQGRAGGGIDDPVQQEAVERRSHEHARRLRRQVRGGVIVRRPHPGGNELAELGQAAHDQARQLGVANGPDHRLDQQLRGRGVRIEARDRLGRTREGLRQRGGRGERERRLSDLLLEQG